MTQIFIGNISQDVKKYSSGVNIFSLAYNPPGKDQKAIFIRCIMFKDTADIHRNMISYLTKGCSLVVTGTISENQAYINRNNEPAATISLIVSAIQFMPRKKRDDNELTQSTQSNQGITVRDEYAKEREADAKVKF